MSNSSVLDNKIKALYLEGKTIKQITKEVGVSVFIVRNSLDAQGVKRRTSGESRILNSQGFVATPKEELFELYVNQRLSSCEIAKIYNVSTSSVRRQLEKLEIPMRTMQESKFKGEKRLDKKGYVIISYYDEEGNYCRQHEHRYVMEKHLGRKLTPDEDVHHVDFDKTNNDISNLRVLSHKEHAELHYNIQKLERINWMIDYVKTNKCYPKYEEMPFERNALRKDWGSMKEAYQVVYAETGIKYMHPGEKTLEECFDVMYEFELRTGSAPRIKDFKENTVGVKWDTVRRRFDSASDVWSAYEAYKKSKRNI